ncbi:hypothetical protein LL240_09625 [Oceanimonas baumannii]|uniref:hypothetical protein n=1 Tax=Oceanimonas baumannii TaxID=129578 RepID=UPI001D18489A|nr:hypothetical protein [Oceanimonas baumannii]MCC4264714.1 hypothetical protein [Oceanimonas baumannii]
MLLPTSRLTVFIYSVLQNVSFACALSTKCARVQQKSAEKISRQKGLGYGDVDNEQSRADSEHAHFYHGVIALKERK